MNRARPQLQKIRYELGRDHIGWYGTSSTFTRIRHDLQRSAAYVCLKPTAKLVLIDFLDYFERESGFDTDYTIHERGLCYTFGMCNQPISRTTFFAAIRDIQAKGFIHPHRKIHHRPGSAKIWQPSLAWQRYQPAGPDIPLLADYIARKITGAPATLQTTFDFVTGLGNIKIETLTDVPGIEHISTIIARQHAYLQSKELAAARAAFKLKQ